MTPGRRGLTLPDDSRLRGSPAPPSPLGCQDAGGNDGGGSASNAGARTPRQPDFHDTDEDDEARTDYDHAQDAALAETLSALRSRRRDPSTQQAQLLFRVEMRERIASARTPRAIAAALLARSLQPHAPGLGPPP